MDRQNETKPGKKPLKKNRTSNISIALFGNENWELFEGIPKHLPFRTRVRMKLRHSTFGHIWEMFQTLFALCASVLYVMQTYETSLEADTFELVSLVVFSIDYLLNFYCCENRFLFVISFTAVMDAATIVPALLDRISGHDSENGAGSFPFLRFVRVLRLLRLMRVVKVAGSRSVSAVQKQIQTIILLITSIVFISAGIFHAVESANRLPDDPQVTFGDALYFLVVTITTVGYGDISPLTTYGKMVTAAVIVVSFTIVPAEVSRLTQLMALQSPFRKSYQPPIGNPHILVVGHITDPSVLLDFFKEFYHPDRLEDGIYNSLGDPPCVLMSPQDPTETIINLLDHPMLQNRVTFIKGSVMSEEDLCRVGADTARACFVLVEKSTDHAEKSDAETVLRLLAIRNYNPELEVYTQIVCPTYSDYVSEMDTDHVLCINKVKLGVLSKSCVCPGLVTLISNMFRSCSVPKNDAQEGWEKEYIDGLSLEVYATSLPTAFYDLSFSQAANLMYQCTNGEVILMGVLEYKIASNLPTLSLNTTDNSEAHSLYINPGNTMLMAAGQMVYVLSESKKLAQPSSVSAQLKEWLSAGNTLPPPSRLKLLNPQLPIKRSSSVVRTPVDVMLEEAVDPTTGKDLEGHIIVVTDLDETSLRIFIKPLRSHLGDPTTQQQVLFLSWSIEGQDRAVKVLQQYENIYLMTATGDSKSELLRANITKAKRCILLADKSKIDQFDGEAVDSRTIFHYLAVQCIQSDQGNHCHTGLFTIVELSAPRTMKILDSALRKRLRQNGPRQKIVLHSRHIKEEESPKKHHKTGVVQGIFSHGKDTIHSIKKIITTRKKVNSRLSIIRKEEESKKKSYDSSSSCIMLPFFAAGYGFADDIFDNMLCQSYFTPGLIRFADELLFSENGRTSKNLFETHESNLHHYHSRIASSLVQFPIPKAFVSKTFGELFVFLVATENTIPIGLYRCSGSSHQLPYVVTGPGSHTTLRSDDLMFVLAQPEAIQIAIGIHQAHETSPVINEQEIIPNIPDPNR